MNRYTPYTTNRDRKRVTNFDRHCQSCGVMIKGQAHYKPAECFKCKAPQEGRNGWDSSGWGRCLDCDCWINWSHCYCQCGFANPEAIERKRKNLEEIRKQEALKKEKETAELRQRLGEMARANMMLQKEIDDKNEAEKAAKENEIFVNQMEGVVLGDDGDDAE